MQQIHWDFLIFWMEVNVGCMDNFLGRTNFGEVWRKTFMIFRKTGDWTRRVCLFSYIVIRFSINGKDFACKAFFQANLRKSFLFEPTIHAMYELTGDFKFDNWCLRQTITFKMIWTTTNVQWVSVFDAVVVDIVAANNFLDTVHI